MGGLGLLTCGSEMDKLRFLFEVYDVDGTLPAPTHAREFIRNL